MISQVLLHFTFFIFIILCFHQFELNYPLIHFKVLNNRRKIPWSTTNACLFKEGEERTDEKNSELKLGKIRSENCESAWKCFPLKISPSKDFCEKICLRLSLLDENSPRFFPFDFKLSPLSHIKNWLFLQFIQKHKTEQSNIPEIRKFKFT